MVIPEVELFGVIRFWGNHFQLFDVQAFEFQVMRPCTRLRTGHIHCFSTWRATHQYRMTVLFRLCPEVNRILSKDNGTLKIRR